MTTVLTRGLVWAGLALFLYVLLTRLRTLAMLAGTQRGLGETAAVRIRASRIAVETLVVVAVLGVWATSTLNRGHLDWHVEGAGSHLHLELAGAWFVVGAAGLTAAVTLLLIVTGMMAFARATDLREALPRSGVGRPHVLRLAVMNPGVVFVTRRAPLVWAWTELRAAAFGIVATLAAEAVHHEVPAADTVLSEAVDDVGDELELDERLAGRGPALTWNEMVALLARAAGVAPGEPDPLPFPPADAPVGARAAGFWLGLITGMRASRRTRRRAAMLARFDERASIRTVLETAPGPLASAYRDAGLDGLLHDVRGAVFDSLKRQLPRRKRRQLTKAYRQHGMDGAAAWMIEKIASYPEHFRHGVQKALDREASFIDSIVADFQRRQGR